MRVMEVLSLSAPSKPSSNTDFFFFFFRRQTRHESAARPLVCVRTSSFGFCPLTYSHETRPDFFTFDKPVSRTDDHVTVTVFDMQMAPH